MADKKQEQPEMSENAAIIPDFAAFDKMRTERVEAEAQEVENAAIKSEKHVASLADHSGWKEVEKHIVERITALQKGVQGAIANGSTFVEIGQRAVVAKMVQEELEGVLNFVRTREKYVKENKN